MFRYLQFISLLTVLLLVFTSVITRAQIKEDVLSGGETSFRIHDQHLASLLPITFTIEFSKEGINTNSTLDINKVELNVEKGGPFDIHVQPAINYGKIQIQGVKLPPYISNQFKGEMSLYIFETGDQITLNFQGDTILFSGIGSGKYNCLYRLYRTKRKYSEPSIAPGLAPAVKNKRILAHKLSAIDSLYRAKQDLLKDYKSELNPEVYNLIGADLWAEYNQNIISIFSTIIFNSPKPMLDVEWNDVVSEFYNNFCTNFDSSKFNENILAQSYQYVDFLLNKEIFAIKFTSTAELPYYNIRFKFSDLIEVIKRNYTGLVLDKLLLITCYRSTRMMGADATSFLSLASGMGDHIFREKLMRFSENFASQAYDFELEDKNGKYHKLSAFRGKVVVLDFWFTGCGGCAGLHERLKPLLIPFKDRSDIVFIPISIDTHKEIWLESVEKQIYSNKEDLNLYTGYLGKNHPLIKKFNVQGYPCIVVIDKKGRIVSAGFPNVPKNVSVGEKIPLIETVKSLLK